MSKKESRRTYNFADAGICEKYFPFGTRFSDAQTILLSAGTKVSKIGDSVFSPDYNRNLPPDSPDRNDLSSGFVLESSWISSVIFVVTFRPEDVNTQPEKIGKIVNCFARGTGL